MNDKLKNDVFYVCSLIEYIARKTKNHRCVIVDRLQENEIENQLYLADVNHCLSFEQVSDELIDRFGITDGIFDTVSSCKYKVPSETSIGKVYQNLVLSQKNDNVAKTIMDVFSSFISDEISNFNSNVYYSNPDYIRCSYEEGKLLA